MLRSLYKGKSGREENFDKTKWEIEKKGERRRVMEETEKVWENDTVLQAGKTDEMKDANESP